MTDFLAALGVGISQIVIGHPFDTEQKKVVGIIYKRLL
jgi:hypothetical protein